MEQEDYGKQYRILEIYTRLLNGEKICKREMANHYGVNERTIQRDLEILRGFVEEDEIEKKEIVYSRRENCYKLIQEDSAELTDAETLAICKILLESRAFTTHEMNQILSKLLKENNDNICKKKVKELISNERHNYIQLMHGKELITILWDLGQAINRQQIISMEYIRLDGKAVCRRIKPVGIMFSEFYFYLIAFHEDTEIAEKFEMDKLHPTIYRVDRIQMYTVEEEHFSIPYGSRFEESEFRQRIQFMYGGDLVKLKFIYKGQSIEAVKDRFPTAQCILNQDGTYTVTAEVFGSEGVDMWVRSQGEKVSICSLV